MSCEEFDSFACNEHIGILINYFRDLRAFKLPIVVYFDQHLGAVHSKHKSKSTFSTFCVQKAEKERKSKKIEVKFST